MNELSILNQKLRRFLKEHLRLNQGFDSRFYYAPNYALAWLKNARDLTPEEAFILNHEHQKLDQDSHDFHFEFNHYAAQEYGTSPMAKAEQLKFRGTTCTNWSLLRLVVELKAGKSSKLILGEVKQILNRRQMKSGFIVDEPHVRSFQYHCFSMSLLGEIYEITNDPEIKECFLHAADFIMNFILPNGEIFYIGRGQYQIFGMGPLLWSLILSYQITNREKYLSKFLCCFNYLKDSQYNDGRFPLVLTNQSEPLQSQRHLQDQKIWGWYGYNNLFDYLTFLGFYLHKVETLITDLSLDSQHLESTFSMKNYRDKDFQIIVQDSYTAIISRPGGAWSNDLPVPIIFSHKKNKTVTPCYGGEQFLPSLTSLKGLAYPVTKNAFVRKSGRGFLLHHSWMWLSLQGVFKRDFNFQSDHVTIRDYYFSPWKLQDQLLLFQDAELINPRLIQTADLEIFSPSELSEREIEYSASGPLKSFVSDSHLRQWVVKIR